MKTNKGFLFCIVVGVIAVVLASCSDGTSPAAAKGQETRFMTVTSVGVVVYGYKTYDGKWVQNTNSFPVRVKQYRWHSSDGGYYTLQLMFMEPYEKKVIASLESYDVFHVYDMRGVEIGFITKHSMAKLVEEQSSRPGEWINLDSKAESKEAMIPNCVCPNCGNEFPMNIIKNEKTGQRMMRCSHCNAKYSVD